MYHFVVYIERSDSDALASCAVSSGQREEKQTKGIVRDKYRKNLCCACGSVFVSRIVEHNQEMENPWEQESSLKHINTTRITIPAGNDDCVVVEGMPEEEVEQPLSPWSKAFHDPVFNVHILAVFGSRTPLDESKGKEWIRQLILKHPRFSSVVVGEKRKEFKWARVPKVNFDDHLVVPVIDHSIIPGSEMADKYVEDYMHSLSKEMFDKSSRPLWDLHFLKLKTCKEEGIIIFRFHHSLGDGASLMSLLLSCSRNASDPTALPMFPMSKKNEIVRGDSHMHKYWKVFNWLWWVVVLVWNTSVDALMILATSCFLKDTNTPIKGKSLSVTFRPRRFVYRTIHLDDIKLVKNMMDATINDVAIGITQAGLSYYLNRKYNASDDHGSRADNGVIENKVKIKKLLRNIRLRSAVTVNIRPPGIQDFSEIKNNSKAKLGNLIGFFLLPFTIGLQDDPLNYIREAKITANRRKHSLVAKFTFLPMLFGSKVSKALFLRGCANTTLSFSNVVGPSQEIIFCGHQIDVIMSTAYGYTHASWITFTSCGNQMALAVSVDEDTIPDPHQLCDDIIESFKLIKEAVVARHT